MVRDEVQCVIRNVTTMWCDVECGVIWNGAHGMCNVECCAMMWNVLETFHYHMVVTHSTSHHTTLWWCGMCDGEFGGMCGISTVVVRCGMGWCDVEWCMWNVCCVMKCAM